MYSALNLSRSLKVKVDEDTRKATNVFHLVTNNNYEPICCIVSDKTIVVWPGVWHFRVPSESPHITSYEHDQWIIMTIGPVCSKFQDPVIWNMWPWVWHLKVTEGEKWCHHSESSHMTSYQWSIKTLGLSAIFLEILVFEICVTLRYKIQWCYQNAHIWLSICDLDHVPQKLLNFELHIYCITQSKLKAFLSYLVGCEIPAYHG